VRGREPVRDGVGDAERGLGAVQAELLLVEHARAGIERAELVDPAEAVVEEADPARLRRVRAAAQGADTDTGADDKYDVPRGGSEGFT
jgi:hypothetical protein